MIIEIKNIIEFVERSASMQALQHGDDGLINICYLFSETLGLLSCNLI